MRTKRLPLTVGGDGRADSPGHSAKYGSYSLLDLDYMLVIDVQLVQVFLYNIYFLYIWNTISDKLYTLGLIFNYITIVFTGNFILDMSQSYAF